MRPAALALCAWAILWSSAWAQGPASAGSAADRLKALQADPVALKAAVESGRKSSFFCANCHGEDGNSKTPDVPNLAGQNPLYLLEQIRKFSVGERKDSFMQGLIKVLREEERLQIAVAYGQSRVVPGKADPALAARGKPLFEKFCVRCHGDEARGNEAIPRLAGQKIPYLQTSITRYRDKTGERNEPLMTIATAVLKNEDIAAISHYLGQLP